MARFIGYVSGMKGEASRLGSENSGISATARGWEIGARVAIQTVGGEDILTVRIDGGSNGQRAGRCLGEWKRNEAGLLYRRVAGVWTNPDAGPICEGMHGEPCGKPMTKVSVTYCCANHHLKEVRA